MSAQQAFSVDLSLVWEWEECNSFDVASGSTQILPSHNALKFTWGEHCIVVTKIARPRSNSTCICACCNYHELVARYTYIGEKLVSVLNVVH